MVKIVNAETQLALLKPLDEDQKQLIQTKPSVEKALVELESIKAHLEDVAKEVIETYHCPNHFNFYILIAVSIVILSSHSILLV